MLATRKKEITKTLRYRYCPLGIYLEPAHRAIMAAEVCHDVIVQKLLSTYEQELCIGSGLVHKCVFIESELSHLNLWPATYLTLPYGFYK